jgi:cytochrome c-type biogenesis protein CcmH/NrfF
MVGLSSRVLWRWFLERRSESQQQESVGVTKRPWRSDYEVLESLLPHYGDFDKRELLLCILHSFVGAKCFQASTALFTKSTTKITTTTTTTSRSDVVLSFGEIFARFLLHVCQAKTNVFGIYDIEPETSSSASSSTSTSSSLLTTTRLSQRRVGSGFYPLCSLLNHSCDPNSALSYPHLQASGSTLDNREGKRKASPLLLVIRAGEDIGQDTEVTISYGPHFVRQSSLQERQIPLLSQYYFTCKCPVCTTQQQLSDSRAASDSDIIVVQSDFKCSECQCCLLLGEGKSVVSSLKCPVCKKEVSLSDLEKQAQIATQLYLVGRQALTSLLDSTTLTPSSSSLFTQPSVNNDREKENKNKLRFGTKALKGFENCVNLRLKLYQPFHGKIAEVEDALAETLATLGDYGKAASHSANSIASLRYLFQISRSNQPSYPFSLSWSSSAFSFERPLTEKERGCVELGQEYFKLAQLFFNSKKVQEAWNAIENAILIHLTCCGFLLTPSSSGGSNLTERLDETLQKLTQRGVVTHSSSSRLIQQLLELKQMRNTLRPFK